MEQLLNLLRGLPDYRRLLACVEKNRAAGVSGAAQINRSHLIASLLHDTGRPAVLVCQDEMAARRTQAELSAFLGVEAPILPSRDLTFHNASAISRGWEHQRLRLLYALAQGRERLVLTTFEALALRTTPKSTLVSAALTASGFCLLALLCAANGRIVAAFLPRAEKFTAILNLALGGGAVWLSGMVPPGITAAGTAIFWGLFPFFTLFLGSRKKL